MNFYQKSNNDSNDLKNYRGINERRTSVTSVTLSPRYLPKSDKASKNNVMQEGSECLFNEG